MLLQTIVHYFLHLIFPVLISRLFFRNIWHKAYVIMLLTMAVDLDHLLANPIFDPNRFGIGFHILHSYPAIFSYIIIFAISFLKPHRLTTKFIPKKFTIKPDIFWNLRLISLGLLLHMATDYQDCLWM